MKPLAAFAAIVLCLTSCAGISETNERAQRVRTELESAFGVAPFISSEVSNGRLTDVQVVLPAGAVGQSTVEDVFTIVERSVAKHFPTAPAQLSVVLTR